MITLRPSSNELDTITGRIMDAAAIIRPRGESMTKLFLMWLFGSLGLGYFSYMVPYFLLFITAKAMLIGQAIPIDLWNAKDIASLGGFATFAVFMSWLHLRTIDRQEKETARQMKIILTMVQKGYTMPPDEGQ